jgi:hypothetical protein
MSYILIIKSEVTGHCNGLDHLGIVQEVGLATRDCDVAVCFMSIKF